jgi:hypothetical protein
MQRTAIQAVTPISTSGVTCSLRASCPPSNTAHPYAGASLGAPIRSNPAWVLPCRSQRAFAVPLAHITMLLLSLLTPLLLHKQPRTVRKSVARPNGRSYFADRHTPQADLGICIRGDDCCTEWAVTVSTGDADDFLRDGFT